MSASTETLLSVTPIDSFAPKTPITCDPSVHDLHELAVDYDNTVSALRYSYPNIEDNKERPNAIRLCETLSAAMKMAHEPLSLDVVRELRKMVNDITALRGEWAKDGVVTTRDLITVADLANTSLSIITNSYDSTGARRKGLRNRLVAWLA